MAGRQAARGGREAGGARGRRCALVAALLVWAVLADSPSAGAAELDTALEAHLQTLWAQMIDALARKDFATALGFVHSRTRETYRRNFQTLEPQLPQAALPLRQIRLVRVEGDRAICEIVQGEGGATRTFPLHFLRDETGRWWIEEM